MSLSSDKRALNRQLNELNKTDNDAQDINKRLNKLEDAISDDIQSDMLSSILDALSDFRDAPAASMNDSNINKAKNYIDAEIDTIEAVIRARKRAKEAMAGGK